MSHDFELRTAIERKARRLFDSGTAASGAPIKADVDVFWLVFQALDAIGEEIGAEQAAEIAGAAARAARREFAITERRIMLRKPVLS